MEKVKRFVEAGLSIPSAIKEALAMQLIQFADKHGQPRGTTSEVVNGKRWPTPGIIDALISELGGTEYEWRLLLWEAARPAPPAERHEAPRQHSAVA